MDTQQRSPSGRDKNEPRSSLGPGTKVDQTPAFKSYSLIVRSARQRIKWPSLDVNLRQKILHSSTRVAPSQTTIIKTNALLDDEFAMCNVQSALADHDPAMRYHYYLDHKEDYGPLLKLLYWRGRQQSAVFDCFQQLCMRGFIQGGNFSLPMSIRNSTESVLNLSWLIQCFEAPSQAKDLDRGSKVYLEGYEFDLPFRWLATMIGRSSADTNGLLDNISAIGYLGKLDEEAFAIYEEHCPSRTLACDPKAQACEPHLPANLDSGYHMEYEQHPQNEWWIM